MTTITTELTVLVFLALLAASLWVPYIVGVNLQKQAADAPDPFVRPGNLSDLPAWVHRAHRAHLNMLEQFLPFAVLVLLVDRLGAYSALTYWTALAFLGLRLAHAIGMISGLARMPVRPILFSLGWICCLLMAYAVFTASI